MTVIFIAAVVGISLGIAAAIRIALADVTVEVPGSAAWTAGNLFLGPRPTDRPRGFQEEDLPRFVFKSEASAA